MSTRRRFAALLTDACRTAVLVLATIAPAVGAADDPSRPPRAEAVAGPITGLVLDPATGNPGLLRFAAGPAVEPGSPTTRKALVALDGYATVLGLREPQRQLQWLGNRQDPIGGEQALFRQVYLGIPVFGSLIRVHMDARGALRAINGTVISDIDVDPVPLIDAHVAEAAAARVVAKQRGREVDRLDVGPAVLLVYRVGLVRGRPGRNHLAWEVEVASPPDLHEVIYLDAHDGRVLDQRSEIHRLDRTVHLGSYPHPIWSEGDQLPYSSGNASRDAEVNELIAATGDTHQMFANLTGGQYLSFDGLDATMHSVHDADSIDCPNAVESGGITLFCVGMVSDDVVAHEWVHAYTDWTHGLVYQWQPGALNEATSDIFGELVDQLNGRGTDLPAASRPPSACSNAGGSPQPTLDIHDPPSVAGAYATGGAVFNPLPPWTVSGTVELVNDGTGNLADACQPITALTTGSIALIDRGTCYFRDKVVHAEAAGAVAVIIVNHEGNGIFEMGGDLPRLQIPAVLIGLDDGNRIKAALGAGVTASLSLDGELTDTVRWLIGEDTDALGSIRDMWSPSCFGDPDRVGSGYYACSELDNGGVHTNSGIPNHAFALLADGGIFNGHRIEAIGTTKAARIYWRAMAHYQTPVTGFATHADLLEASCFDLVGATLHDPLTGVTSAETITPDDCDQVAEAMAAVEMRDRPDQCDFSPLLDPGAPPLTGNLVLLDESFDADPGSRWELGNRGVFPEYTARDWVWTDELPDGGDGGAFFAIDSVVIGDCQPGSDDQSGIMELTGPVVDIPHGAARPVLSFDHWMASEAVWDGGNLKLSVNGGPFAQVSPSRFLFNPYNDRINTSNTNPLAGEWAFTGTDEGSLSGSWGQSQVDLDGLVAPGDRLRLRFDFGVDGCNGALGWYVDNVRIVASFSGPRRSGGRVQP